MKRRGEGIEGAGVLIAIVDYGMGNLRSIANALDYLGITNEITSDPQRLRQADRLILPGVGAFGAAMESLRERRLREPLDEEVRRGKPILGICLGMQLLAERSSEGGLHEGFGWIEGRVERIETIGATIKVPHIGWNPTELREGSRLFSDVPSPSDFYYVHSYVLHCDAELVAGRCEYGSPVVAAVEHRNVFGTQFHPEKSHAQGLSVLRNFAALTIDPE